MRHSFDNIQNAFEFVSSAPVDENHAIFNLNTGEILQKSGMLDEEEFPEDVEESDDVVWIPHRDDLDLGKELVFDFVDLYLPHEKKAIKAMFRFGRANAHSKFLAHMERLGKLEEWRAFEKEETRNALLDWCDENEIEVDVEE
jgi:hypothetical protein